MPKPKSLSRRARVRQAQAALDYLAIQLSESAALMEALSERVEEIVSHDVSLTFEDRRRGFLHDVVTIIENRAVIESGTAKCLAECLQRCGA